MLCVVENAQTSKQIYALRDAKVSMLTHTYQDKPLRNIKWPFEITRLTAYFTTDLMSNLAICKH